MFEKTNVFTLDDDGSVSAQICDGIKIARRAPVRVHVDAGADLWETVSALRMIADHIEGPDPDDQAPKCIKDLVA